MTDLNIRNIINSIRKKKHINNYEDIDDSYINNYDYNNKQIKKTKRIILFVIVAALIIVICIVSKMLKNIATQQNMQENILDVKQLCQHPKNIIIMSPCQGNQITNKEQEENEEENEQTEQQDNEEEKQEDNKQMEEQTKQQKDIKNENETKEQQDNKQLQEQHMQKDNSAETSAEINKEDLIKLMNLKQNINEMNTITNNNIKTLQRITQKYNDIDNSIKDIKELYEKIEIIKEPQQIEERKQKDNEKEISQDDKEDNEKLI